MLPRKSKSQQPSSNPHSSYIGPNVDFLHVDINHVRIVRFLLWQSRMRGRCDVGSTIILHVESHVVHDLVEMPNKNPDNVHELPRESYMTNVSTSSNHNNPRQVYVSTTSPAMVMRRSNRLNGVGLDVQYHDNYEMSILGKIVKKFARDFPELENVNSSMCKLVHVYGVVVSMFSNVEDEVHMLIFQLFGGGG